MKGLILLPYSNYASCKLLIEGDIYVLFLLFLILNYAGRLKVSLKLFLGSSTRFDDTYKDISIPLPFCFHFLVLS